MAHSSKNISLSEYLEDVHNGNILVTQFQRDFVWSKGKMLKLASSLLKGYPIGSFLLMQDSGEYSSTVINSVDTNSICTNPGNRLLILDGQQRTTTAYQILYGKGKFKFYFDYKYFIEDVMDENNDTIKTIIEDKIEDWLVALPIEKSINNPSEQEAKGLFPLDIILNGSNNQDYSLWLDTYTTSNSLGNNYQLNLEKNNMLIKCKSFFIREIIKSITSYQASEIIIDKNTSPNIVCTIFETINSTGQKLTIFDLLNAKCFPSGFILRQELEKAFETYDILNEYDYDKDSLIGISLIKTIGLLCKKSCKKSDLLKLSATEIRIHWDKALNFIINALNFMRTNFGVLGIEYFPYKDILPVMSVIINNDKFNNNPSECIRKLDRWYWYTIFTGYFDNATDSKSIKTVKEFLGSERDKGWFDDDNLIPEVIRTSELNNFDGLDTLTSTQSAQYKAILNLLTLNGIQDFNYDRVEISKLKEKQLNDHHIYPKKFLNHYKINGDKANTILNRTLITQESNLRIKDMPPSEYLKSYNIVGNEFSTKELVKHCIQKDYILNTFTKESFEDFKQERKKLIIELIKQHL